MQRVGCFRVKANLKHPTCQIDNASNYLAACHYIRQFLISFQEEITPEIIAIKQYVLPSFGYFPLVLA
jgi:hypothetical protein